jgi:monofunctional biosynthetic peptidoglycan transglycosylase
MIPSGRLLTALALLMLFWAPVARAEPQDRDRAPAGRDAPMTMTAVIDFDAPQEPWQSIDDAVMGGVSHSEMVISDGIAVFRGVVSLDNNGGFASVRSQPRLHDLSELEGLVVRVRGDGKRYGFRVRTTSRFDGVSYQVALETPAGEWREVVLPFDRFEPVFRGRRVADAPALDPGTIRTFGLIIAGSQAGPFRLELEWIRGYRPPA